MDAIERVLAAAEARLGRAADEKEKTAVLLEAMAELQKRSRPVESVVVIKRMRTVEGDPVAELRLAHRCLQLRDRLAQSQSEDMPKPRLALLRYGFPDDPPLTSSTAPKIAFSGFVLRVRAFS